MSNYQKEQIEKYMKDLQDRIWALQMRHGNNFVMPGYKHMTTLICQCVGIDVTQEEIDDLKTWLPPKQQG
jgi:hypothetical protein